MSAYAGSQALYARRSQQLLGLAIDHDWTARIFESTRRIQATRGDAEVSIWLSKAGAVLDVNLKLPNGHFADNGQPVYKYYAGRGRAYAEARLTTTVRDEDYTHAVAP